VAEDETGIYPYAGCDHGGGADASRTSTYHRGHAADDTSPVLWPVPDHDAGEGVFGPARLQPVYDTYDWLWLNWLLTVCTAAFRDGGLWNGWGIHDEHHGCDEFSNVGSAWWPRLHPRIQSSELVSPIYYIRP
jgi:hypothetical protein